MTSTLAPARPATPRPDTVGHVDSPAHPGAGGRDPWFDTAKMALVTLVVVGHAWGALPDSALNRWLHDFLYLWHIPALVMLTGHLSRSFRWTRPQLSRLLRTVVAPYVVGELAVAAFRVGVRGQGLDRAVVDPHWPLWFLAALVVWRLAVPLLRSPAGLTVAVVVSLAGGLADTELLDLSRVLGLLPFFVLGLVARREHLALLRRTRARGAAVAVVAAAACLTVAVDGPTVTEWLYWRSGYAELGVTVAEGVATRAGLLVVAGVVAVACLALVPGRDGWFSRLGAASLVVYLGHGAVVKAFEYAGPSAWLAGHPVAGLVVATGGAVLLAVTLAAPPVAARLEVLVDPVSLLRRRRRR